MWDFFKELLIRHGLAAVVIVVVLFGAGWLIRYLLKSWREAQKQLRDQYKSHAKALAAKDVEKAELEKEHAEEMRMVTEQFAERIDTLQERRVEEARERVEEAREVTKTVVKHVEHTKNSVEKITVAMETLSSAVSGRGR